MSNTPGVFIEERSTLPPSVAKVATAIPAFIGYTEKGPWGIPVRIESMIDFRERFGEAFESISVSYAQVEGKVPVTTVTVNRKSLDEADKFVNPELRMPYALEMFFQNGGGRCYVVGVAKPGGVGKPGGSNTTLESALKAVAGLDEPTLLVIPDAMGSPEHQIVCEKAIEQCAKLKDRFAILDVNDALTGVADFREFGIVAPSYGAAYYPPLRTSLPLKYREEAVSVTAVGGAGGPTNLKDEKSTAVANAIRRRLNELCVILPPSAAVAGVYARVDRGRGVWKAPANEAIVGVIGPVVTITDDAQGDLNIDPTGGKSINAIRAFTGRGTLIWGARTLAGNDNEWKYIPVRRLFLMIEESARKATSFAVFEPNDATTWLKVKGMLESYLYELWEKGALQGSKPEAAYYVNVGLGRTMTQRDILEGRVVVEIGVAAVRPAEFITLSFSHMLASA